VSDLKVGLLGTEIPLDMKNPPEPCCASCGRPVPYFYSYIHNLKLPDGMGTLQFQTYCCPHSDCIAIIITMPIGIEPGKVAAPGRPGWPS
jgi:hypothetical protein